MLNVAQSLALLIMWTATKIRDGESGSLSVVFKLSVRAVTALRPQPMRHMRNIFHSGAGHGGGDAGGRVITK